MEAVLSRHPLRFFQGNGPRSPDLLWRVLDEDGRRGWRGCVVMLECVGFSMLADYLLRVRLWPVGWPEICTTFFYLSYYPSSSSFFLLDFEGLCANTVDASLTCHTKKHKYDVEVSLLVAGAEGGAFEDDLEKASGSVGMQSHFIFTSSSSRLNPRR